MSTAQPSLQNFIEFVKDSIATQSSNSKIPLVRQSAADMIGSPRSNREVSSLKIPRSKLGEHVRPLKSQSFTEEVFK